MSRIQTTPTGTRLDPGWLPGAGRLPAPEDADGLPWQLARAQIDGPWRIAAVLAGYEFSHAGFIAAVAAPPDGSFVVTGGADAAVRMWEPVYGREIESWTYEAPVTAVTVTDDATLIIAADQDSGVTAISTATGDIVWHVNRRYPATALATTNDRVFAAGKDGYVRVLSREDGRELADVRALGPVTSVAIVGNRMFTASFRGISMVDLMTMKPVLRTDRDASVVVPFDTGLLAVAEGCDLVIRRASDLVTVHDFRAHDEPLTALLEAPDGRVATAAWDGRIRLWDPTSGDMIAEHRTGGDGAVGLAQHPDGILFAAGRRLDLWHDEGSTPVARRVHRARITDMAASPDGSRLVTASGDGSVGIYDVEEGRPIAWLDDFRGAVTAVDTDGKRVLAATDHGHVRLVRLSDEGGLRVLRTRETAEEGVSFVALGPDAAFAVTRATGHVYRLEPNSNLREIARLDQVPASLALSPDARRLAIGDEAGRVWVVPAAGNSDARMLEAGGRRVGAVGFWPDGSHVLAAGEDGFLRVWSADGFVTHTVALPATFIPDSLQVAETGYVHVSGRGSLEGWSRMPVWVSIDLASAHEAELLTVDLWSGSDCADSAYELSDDQLVLATTRTGLLVLARNDAPDEPEDDHMPNQDCSIGDTYYGLTDDLEERKEDHGNPEDFERVRTFSDEEAARAWERDQIAKDGCCGGTGGKGWKYGYRYTVTKDTCE